jgi:hypothetical protein
MSQLAASERSKPSERTMRRDHSPQGSWAGVSFRFEVSGCLGRVERLNSHEGAILNETKLEEVFGCFRLV